MLFIFTVQYGNTIGMLTLMYYNVEFASEYTSFNDAICLLITVHV